MSIDTTSPMRADARRNRESILAAAEVAFAEDGLGVPVDEIARRAGVGAGTLYRHFPTKEALFESVIIEHLRQLAARAHELVEAEDPTGALFDFLRRLAEEGCTKRNLVEALAGSGIDIKVVAADVKADMDGTCGILLARAQESGGVRRDVTLSDVFGLIMGTCAFAGETMDPESQARMMSVVCAGLRSST